jgi:hypothetical protein
MPQNEDSSDRGQIIPIEFGGKVIAAKRKCTCGGDVEFIANPEGQGKIAVCQVCGASLAFGSPSS